MDANGLLKLTDFGLSHGASRSLTRDFLCVEMDELQSLDLQSWESRQNVSVYTPYRHGKMRAFSVVGSPDYMAVEILEETDKGYSFASDWWSLGCLIFECLCGMFYFDQYDFIV